jgi:hypothetical protein
MVRSVARLSWVPAMLAALTVSAPNAAPVNLAAAIRATVKLQPAALLDGAQMAPLRATSGPQLGDAMTCLKLAGPPPAYIAVFFDRGQVLSYRRAVAYDRCEEGPYSALAAPAKPAGAGRGGHPFSGKKS